LYVAKHIVIIETIHVHFVLEYG